MCKTKNPNCYFHSAYRFATRTLAIEVDSLVRVSRRVEKNHLAIVTNQQYYTSSHIGGAHSRSLFPPSVGLRRIESRLHACIGVRVSSKHYGTQKRTYNAKRYYQNTRNTMATLHKKHCRRPDQITALAVQIFTLAYNNLAKRNWLHSLPS